MKAKIVTNKLFLILCAVTLFLGVVFAEFDLSIGKRLSDGTNPNQLYSGSVVTYILTVDLSDASSGSANNVLVQDVLDPNMIFT